jgi:two-component system, LuxR family, response regulator FixJ
MPATVHIFTDQVGVGVSHERLMASAQLEPVAHASIPTFVDSEPLRGCILIDVRQGHRLYARIKALGIHLQTIVINDRGDIEGAVAAMKLGAFDVIERPAEGRALLSATQRALKDCRPADTTAEMDAKQRMRGLSPRERQVLDALVAGQTNKTIATKLGISVRTVELHRARMLHRIRVPNAAAAIRLAIIAELGNRKAPYLWGLSRSPDYHFLRECAQFRRHPHRLL